MNPVRPARSLAALFAMAGLLLAPLIAFAHERWVPHNFLQPIDHAYFRSMRGEVLFYSLGASGAIACIILLWYLVAMEVVERVTPHTPEARERERRRGPIDRNARRVFRFLLDAETSSPLMERGLAVAIALFTRLPALVLGLGVVQGWLVMPSFPLPHGIDGTILRIVEALLAVWILIGRGLRPLGLVLMAVFMYLCWAYGLAGIDAVPVLASAFFFYFSSGGSITSINTRQLVGIRLSLGVGFFLLGLVNKIYLAELFIGVGDQFPQLIAGPRHLIPGLTREAWSFTTALGEMTFGLLLLLGIFDKLTTIALTLIFTQFIFTFGVAEIVHLYPIAGFVILFFRAPPGTVLDGPVFRVHVTLWRWLGHRSSRAVHALAVAIVAIAAAVLLVLTPLAIVLELVPRLGG